MAVKIFNVGDVLTAADVNEWLMRRYVSKSLLQTVTSSTTLTNDNDLFFTDFQANGVYLVEAYLIVVGVAAGDLIMDFTVPSGCNYHWSPVSLNIQATSDSDIMRMPDTTTGSRSIAAIPSASGGPTVSLMRGLFTMGSTTGTVQLRFAQFVSAANATGFGAGSAMWAQRVA